MKKTAKVFVALLLAFVMVFTMVAAVACTPEEPVDPNEGGTGTPFATAPFNAILTMGDPTAEDGEFTVLQMSNVETAEESGYYNAMILVGVGDDAISLAYAIEDKTVTFYPYDGSAVGATSCGTGTIDGKNLSTSITAKLSDEDEDHTYDISGEMYTLTITGTEDLESWDFPTSLFVSKDSYVGLVLAFQLGDETLTLNGTAVESIETLKMPAQNSTIAITAGVSPEDCDHTDVELNVCKLCGTELTAQEIVDGLYALPTDSITFLYSESNTYKLTGVIQTIDSAYSSDFGNITVTIKVDGDSEGRTVQCYRMKGDGIDTLVAGAKITVTGKLKAHYNTREFDTDCQASEITFPNYDVTFNIENGSVTDAEGQPLAAQYAAGTEISFKVVANSDYKVDSVKVNGSTVQLQGEVYKFVVTGAMTIDVNIVEASAPEAQILATFTLGTDDPGKTNEGNTSQDGTGITDSTGTYEETQSSYTLNITNPTKVYKNSYDAKGNACLKLGTGSVDGSFTFTVPDEITKVVIYVAGYKSNSLQVSINNGNAITVDGRSAQGTYDAIEIDTSEVKTITFSTTGSQHRCKINTIEFWGIPA